jgi:hypothetical protein
VKVAKGSKQLSSKQMLVINALLTGATDIEAAKVAGCHRFTIAKWRAGDPIFIQEYNKRFNDMHTKAIEPFTKRIKELVLLSIATIESAILRGDTTSARWFLDKVSTLPQNITGHFEQQATPPAPMPTNIHEIIENIADNEIKQILKEENLSELDIASCSDFLIKVRSKLIHDLKAIYLTEDEKE